MKFKLIIVVAVLGVLPNVAFCSSGLIDTAKVLQRAQFQEQYPGADFPVVERSTGVTTPDNSTFCNDPDKSINYTKNLPRVESQQAGQVGPVSPAW